MPDRQSGVNLSDESRYAHLPLAQQAWLRADAQSFAAEEQAALVLGARAADSPLLPAVRASGNPFYTD